MGTYGLKVTLKKCTVSTKFGDKCWGGQSKELPSLDLSPARKNSTEQRCIGMKARGTGLLFLFPVRTLLACECPQVHFRKDSWIVVALSLKHLWAPFLSLLSAGHSGTSWLWWTQAVFSPGIQSQVLGPRPSLVVLRVAVLVLLLLQPSSQPGAAQGSRSCFDRQPLPWWMRKGRMEEEKHKVKASSRSYMLLVLETGFGGHVTQTISLGHF